MYRYKDMVAAGTSVLGTLIKEKAHPSVIETVYQRANADFLKSYPQCDDAWFMRMNNGIVSKADQRLSN
jgi:hypothetical protein